MLDAKNSAAIHAALERKESSEVRARLEREVIEAAKKWVPNRNEHAAHHTARQCPTWAAERMFHKATYALIDFESQREK